MQNYSVINVECLKLFEPSMIIEDEVESGIILSSIEDLVPRIIDELKEELILQKKVRHTQRGKKKFGLLGLKVSFPKQQSHMTRARLRTCFLSFP